MRSLRSTLRSAAPLGRRWCSEAPSPREMQLLQQVSRLENRVHELQNALPPHVKPAKVENWEDLGFGIVPTNGHTRYTWSGVTNAWDAGRFISDPFVPLHIHAAVLHYGMTLFEGCKAFRCKDGRIRVCNLNENSARMNTGADRLVLPRVPVSMFNEAVDWAVRANAEYVPPYGSGGSLYIRPFLMGTGPILGLQPCPETTFMVSVTPVGNYFGKGGVQGIHASIMKDFDRAAPKGTGAVKAGGNYAADLLPLKQAKAAGFGTTLYLDCVEQKYVEEFSVSNFVGIDSKGAYVTPKTPSILPSITNKMMMQIAESKGIKVEARPLAWDEVSTFREVGACGTATVCVPIASITDGDAKHEFGKFEVLKELRDELQAIQYGECEDPYGWMREVVV
ncbi:hypothetical protein AB1Y20_004590 [Prymnesium parvum]|uniref:Branched-chain-amino-acid transaminase n=1 Tax=Prymnesium parvum TaxID=97485 RepID=A0AB34IZP2_PRYPA|mmetsp:Transcript_10503/g.26093  ORF Transcript_10503/g.26093 Transcript_10503/m.26093 type:complete len:393 (-) Transcript_10503:445-1623(-)|eukprot:CAMPEP_0182811736 /NCGR_PEP_ID=MMETSP0006_2-20121128/8430_1 /TAXON_ID=97485 /ORGANISM="Prymnesium parvum, Strain Texoma1" /LENGTH=392 /DNA_ID=CAMNT_0024937715 /DNA_START=21 /DNA_END=1199 /DNA_ORIENTATION=-